MAAQIAVAYDNLLLYDEIKRHHEQLTLDMAARIRLDEDLRRFRLAMDATADAIFLVDRAGMCFVDVNADRLPHARFRARGLPARGRRAARTRAKPSWKSCTTSCWPATRAAR